ncbi:MAG: hypothetical protein OXI83_02455, partial [Gemmatimonadota bacterium]|nr:hypothetical protein [Gemmatimonadota bacterium]
MNETTSAGPIADVRSEARRRAIAGDLPARPGPKWRGNAVAWVLFLAAGCSGPGGSSAPQGDA